MLGVQPCDLTVPSSADPLEIQEETPRSEPSVGWACLYSFDSSPISRRSFSNGCGFNLFDLALRNAVRSLPAFFGDLRRCAVSNKLDSSDAATSATPSEPRRLIMTISRSLATLSRRLARFARALEYVVCVAMKKPLLTTVALYNLTVRVPFRAINQMRHRCWAARL